MIPTPNASRKIAIQMQMLLQWDRPVEGWILFDVPGVLGILFFLFALPIEIVSVLVVAEEVNWIWL
jgi:hypothetical protein